MFVTTCGTSFYSQCLPPQTVNLVFSSTAMHWLRDKPCSVTGALHQTMITLPEEAEKFRKQAAKDWETILLARAKELAPGKETQLLFRSSRVCAVQFCTVQGRCVTKQITASEDTNECHRY